MSLTTTQLSALKTSILAETDPSFVTWRQANNEAAMAGWYNANATPAFVLWRTSVTVAQVGLAINSGELAGLTTANNSRLQTMAAYSGGAFNPSATDVRTGFDSVFSGAGGVLTRAALLAAWKRPARRIERLYAVGTGSDASPAIPAWEGTVSVQQISDAMGD